MGINQRDEDCDGMADNCWYDYCIEMENGMVGNDIPECNQDGTYEPLRCNPSTQSCWCVDAYGVHVDDTYYPYDYNVDITGDINLDNSVDVTDIILIVQQILGTPVAHPPCLTDVNSDYTVNILDIMEVVNVILAEDDEPSLCENQSPGDSFYPDDEHWCNICTCDDNGNAMCTLMLCQYDCTVSSEGNATCDSKPGAVQSLQTVIRPMNLMAHVHVIKQKVNTVAVMHLSMGWKIVTLI